jgi:hypothetical protein
MSNKKKIYTFTVIQKNNKNILFCGLTETIWDVDMNSKSKKKMALYLKTLKMRILILSLWICLLLKRFFEFISTYMIRKLKSCLFTFYQLFVVHCVCKSNHSSLLLFLNDKKLSTYRRIIIILFTIKRKRYIFKSNEK